MRSWGLKPRFLLITLSLFAAAGILSFVVFLAAARGIAWSLGTRFAVTNTLLAKNRILGLIDREVVLARKLADSPVIKAWMLDEADSAKSKAARAELESYRAAFKDRSYFVAVAASDTYYNQPADGERAMVRLSENRPADTWFFRSLKTVNDWALNLDYNPHIRATKVWINCAVRDRGRTIGLAGSGIDITGFVADLAAEAKEGLSVMLLDRDGDITVHRDLEYLERNARTWGGGAKLSAADLADSALDRAALRGLLHDIGSDPEAVRTARIAFSGARSLIAASYLPGMDWTILAAVDLDRIISVRNFAAIPAIFLVALVVSLLTLAFLVDRLILQPLGSLTAAAREMARGRYDLAMPRAGVGEIGALAVSFTAMAGEVQAATADLERQVSERTAQLAAANARMIGDLEYADLVQRSILPGERVLDRRVPERFVLFHPRDRVGGDFYFFRDGADSFLLGVADCTGHGVSGALMTMYTESALESIAGNSAAGNPAAMIKELDRSLKAGLGEDARGLGSERGLDIALCRIETAANRILYAGAGVDLFIAGNGGVERIRAGRGSVGSRRRPVDARIVVKELPLGGSDFYLTTDGYLDQAGGKKGFGFGASRFAALIAACGGLTMEEQSGRFAAALEEWQGARPQRDDISVFAFRASSEAGTKA